MDELLAKHKKEQRDLIATTTLLKKQASKKTRKAVNQKCEQMQLDLDARHKNEIRALSGEPDVDPPVEVSPEDLLAALELDQAPKGASMTSGSATVSPCGQPTSGSGSVSSPNDVVTAESGPHTSAPKKRNRAKERLAKRLAQEAAIRAQAEEEAAGSVDYRKIEMELMHRLLAAQNLQLHEIQPDGHCLFRSIEDQLRLRHQITEISVTQLRKQAAHYIRQHPDDFTPYLFDETTLSLRDLSEYTKELEETAMWGSDMELLALSRVYGCPIRVLVAGSAPIVFNEEAEDPELVVAFYKHLYGLGEHYNSCRTI